MSGGGLSLKQASRQPTIWDEAESLRLMIENYVNTGTICKMFSNERWNRRTEDKEVVEVRNKKTTSSLKWFLLEGLSQSFEAVA